MSLALFVLAAPATGAGWRGDGRAAASGEPVEPALAVAPTGLGATAWGELDAEDGLYCCTSVRVAVREPAARNYASVPLRAPSRANDPPQVQVDQEGRVVVVWIGHDAPAPLAAPPGVGDHYPVFREGGSYLRVMASTRRSDGSFTEPQPVSPPGGHAVGLQVALGGHGELIAVWGTLGAPGIGYSQGTLEDGFGPPRIVPGTRDHNGPFRVAMSSGGEAMLVWTEVRADQSFFDGDGPEINSTLKASARPVGGSFGEPQPVATIDSLIAELSLAVGSGGDALAAWIRPEQLCLYCFTNSVEAATRPSGGSFGVPALLHDGSRSHSGLQTTVDANGTATTAWLTRSAERHPAENGGPRVQATIKRRAGGFAAPQNLSSTCGGASHLRIAASRDGNTHLVWLTGGGGQTRVEGVVGGSEGFGQRRVLASGAQGSIHSPTLAVSTTGEARMAWVTAEGSGQRQVQTATYDPQAAETPAAGGC